MKKIIICFVMLYVAFGLTNSMLFGTPNNTNDFVFHYYVTNGDTSNPEFTEYYSVEGTNNYPKLFHFLMFPFSFDKTIFYVAMVLLICVAAPLLLYKVAGKFAVWVYFALSLPHMVLFNSTFASFLILIYFLLYLFFKRKLWAFCLFMLLAVFTHKSGGLFFVIIYLVELIELVFIKYDLVEKLKLKRYNLGAGYLFGHQLNSFTQLINVFLYHANIYFFYLARKSKETFFWGLVVAGFVAAIFIDFRVIMVSQISLAIMLGKLFENNPLPKFFKPACIILMFFNFVWFVAETERFLFFN